MAASTEDGTVFLATLAQADIACPPTGFPLVEISTFGPWHWGTAELDAYGLYMFEVETVIRHLIDDGPVFALCHAGHGINSYGLNLVACAGPVAVFLPHRATPATIYTTRPKATPTDRSHDTHDWVRRDRVDKTGKITLRYSGKLYSIGIGRTHTGTRVIVLIQDLNIRIIDAATGQLLRELILNPSQRYQPTGPAPDHTRQTQRDGRTHRIWVRPSGMS